MGPKGEGGRKKRKLPGRNFLLGKIFLNRENRKSDGGEFDARRKGGERGRLGLRKTFLLYRHLLRGQKEQRTLEGWRGEGGKKRD